MSKLNVVLDLDAEQKSVVFEENFTENFIFFEICVGVRKKSDYQNLSFGYSVRKNGILLDEITRPESNVTYISSDQDFIDFYMVNCEPEIGVDKIDNYYINFWCEEGGERFEKSHSFAINVPRLVDPYPDGIDATPESVGKEYLLENN